ncbi:hypothetical protein J8L88_00610 [Aquimarina sp. MMG015]|uniref:hypothetical protein n=1 Tax=unclassified Aquimarina TaxID=2627091 RepID=UPI000E4E9C04|nr:MULTISPECIES: hypothetical protein [unclassified Aquimarina]AXT57413.1 hypothetical protein D1815_17290 [Aquimarina sp. AD1]MBQ4801331.1 hypothetical protein [Aquimarina sp. MMG015]RKN32737.1 hypothetical protein D7035_05260 [Aquimarina sp. AD1]
MERKGFFLVVITLFYISFVSGQDKSRVNSKSQDSITEMGYRTNSRSTTYKRFSARVGAGVQNSFYSEIGLSRHTCTYSDVGFFSNDYYVAIEWTPISGNDVYGVKIGYEINMIPLLNLGVEGKYQTNFDTNDFVITPKIGLGIFGDVNIFYGYNISTNGNPFPDIGTHQFSVVLNLHKNFLGYL